MRFASEELFWDGIKHEFYSNKFSRVVSPERTLQGTYFRSDERMIKYTVSNSKGSFVKPDDNAPGTASQGTAPGTTVPADTTAVPVLRPAATKHAATQKTATP